MAKNIVELEKQLLLLEVKKEEQVKQLKTDFTAIVDSLKPANIIKRGFNELVGIDKSVTSSPLFTGVASFAGTFLLEEFIFKRGGFLSRVLSSILASGVFQDIIKGEDSVLKKWVLNLKNKFKKKDNPLDTENESELLDDAWPEVPPAK
jgi:hypothetical protein